MQQGQISLIYQDRPSISPLTISMCSACGSLGRPGIRMISPATMTSISAPALITMSRTAKLNPLATPYSFGSVENEY